MSDNSKLHNVYPVVDDQNCGQNPKIKLVYILAASHSGSTLLAMLLNAHPEICTVGELKATSLGDTSCYRCSCLKLIRECPFWKSIKTEMTKKGFDFDVTNAGTDIRTGTTKYEKCLLKPLHRGPIVEKIRDLALSLSPHWGKRKSVISARNKALIESIANLTEKSVIVDSSKIGIRLKYLLNIPKLDVIIIRTVRDGRGVSLTYMNPSSFADADDPKQRQGGIGGNRSDEALSMPQAAREWRRSNEEAQEALKQLPPTQHIQISYEALCQNTSATMRKLFQFIGVDHTIVVDDFRKAEHHIIGNGMRLDSSNKITLDERWRDVLSEQDLTVFDSIAGKLNKSLGYD